MNNYVLALLFTMLWSQAALAECAGSSNTDKCLVGEWLMSDGGPMAWMNQQAKQGGGGIEFTEFTQKPVDPDGAMRFKADGTFKVDPIRARMVGKGPDGSGPAMTMEMTSVTSSSGRWSVQGKTLNLCTDVLNMEGSTRFTVAGTTHEMPVTNPGKGDTSLEYSCQGKTLETRIAIDGSEPMKSQFTRR